jgi:Two component regulator propeller
MLKCLQVLCCLYSFCLYSQLGTGQWRVHVPNDHAIDVVSREKTVYTAFAEGLFEYNTIDQEKRLWTAVNGLSDTRITCLSRTALTNSAVYIGYENGNIDKLENNTVTNIPDIKIAQLTGSKRINRLLFHEGFLYCATGFGIVKIDPARNEVKDTYYPLTSGGTVNDIAFIGDTLFALTNTKLVKVKKDHPAISDPSTWSTVTYVPQLIQSALTYTDIEPNALGFSILKKHEDYGKDSVFYLEQGTRQLVTNYTFDIQINSLESQSGQLVINAAGFVVFYSNGTTMGNYYSLGEVGTWFNPMASCQLDNLLYIADELKGLRVFSSSQILSDITFDGPPRGKFYAMDCFANKLVIASGGLFGIDPTYNDAGIYLFENEQWKLYDHENMTKWNQNTVRDFLSVSINPANTNQVGIGTVSAIPVSLLNLDGQVTDTFTRNNSALSYTNLGLVTSLKFDEKGNLWTLLKSEFPLSVRASDGNWYAYDCGSEAKNKFPKKLVVDYKGNKWFSVGDVGLIGYKDNGTLENTEDDAYVVLNTGAYTGALPSSTINAIAVDFDNEIWIGTESGFAVLYNADNAFTAAAGNYNAQQIKVNFQSEYEYVLNDVNIVDIEVDGGNRKWMATANSGLVLLSADGTEIIENFTTENSPLISNTIIDIQLNHQTGELFIITDKGLVSYRTDATYEDPNYSSVSVFPNPVKPDYSGVVTIQGIRYDSDIKITDVSGKLVYQTTSNGGTATWDCKTTTGEQVGGGVYLIWTAANEGKGNYVGKVLVVR